MQVTHPIGGEWLTLYVTPGKIREGNNMTPHVGAAQSDAKDPSSSFDPVHLYCCQRTHPPGISNRHVNPYIKAQMQREVDLVGGSTPLETHLNYLSHPGLNDREKDMYGNHTGKLTLPAAQEASMADHGAITYKLSESDVEGVYRYSKASAALDCETRNAEERLAGITDSRHPQENLVKVRKD